MNTFHRHIIIWSKAHRQHRYVWHLISAFTFLKNLNWSKTSVNSICLLISIISICFAWVMDAGSNYTLVVGIQNSNMYQITKSDFNLRVPVLKFKGTLNNDCGEKNVLLYKYWLLMRGMVENYCSRGEIQPWSTILASVNSRPRLNFTEGALISPPFPE